MRGGHILACSCFDTLLSMWMVLALDSESLGEPNEQASEPLGEAEGGEFWFPEKSISGSSCGGSVRG